MKAPPDIQSLFNSYLDGDLTDGDMKRLERWLAADSEHAAEFLRWMALQTWTFEALRSEAIEQVLAGGPAVANRPGASTDDAAAGRTSSIITDEPLIRRFGGRRLLVGGSLAAAATLVAIVGIAPSVRRNQPSPPTTRSMAKAVTPGPRTAPGTFEGRNTGISATVAELGDCVWQNPKMALRYGQQLYDGARVVLRSGVLRLTFDSGAQVLLEGPCDFTVDNAMHGTIRRGRLSAAIPPRAFGFRIRSPDAEVIDLGTEFGVSVDAGQCEVHVFKGQVLSRQVDALGDQQGELLHIAENNAIQFRPAPAPPRRMASNTSKFAGRTASQVSLDAPKVLPVDSGLALWLAADRNVRVGDDQRVASWPDSLTGANVTADDALQSEKAAQPKLVANGFNGRPTIRFDGSNSYLVTTPMETTDHQTVLMVCQFRPRAMRPGRRRGGQVLNYNGPPHRLVSSTYEPGVLQFGEPIVDGFAPTRLGAKVFSGRLDGRDVSESEMYVPPIGPNAPIILAYRYDLSGHMASLWCNGELVGEEPALRPIAVTSRKVIGRHGFMRFFFDGDLSELLIYNQALSDEQLGAVTDYLGTKYKISIAGTQATL